MTRITRSLSGPSRTEIREHVLKQLRDSAARDEYAWYPTVGWVGDDGRPFGLAVELFGISQTNAELKTLGRVLLRLASSNGALSPGTIEVARFNRDSKKRVPASPTAQGPQTAIHLVGSGSRSLDVPNSMYCVRLTPGTEGVA